MAAQARGGRAVRAVLVVMAALVIGLTVGAVTEWFPSEALPASTTGSPWVLVSFLVALTAAGTASATAQGLACMVGLTIGYYGAGTFHTYPASSGTAALWVPVAMVIGPLVGLAAGWVRFGPPLLAFIAAGSVPGVLIGEAIAAQARWGTYRRELALAGVAMLAVLLVWQVCRHAAQKSTARTAATAATVALATCLAAGALTVGLYRHVYL